MVSSAGIAVTGAAPSVYRASAAESLLTGKPLTEQTIEGAADAAYDGRELLGDIHASAEYRAALIRVLTRRALEAIQT